MSLYKLEESPVGTPFITPNSHLNITVSGTVSGQRGIALLDNATLSTDNLMSGVYMFRLVNGENVKVQKVVVK